MATKEEVIDGVARETCWMVSQRMSKLRKEAYDTMAVSPFLAPILFNLHHASNFADLGDLLLAGHLMIGHFTSFGKLVDERILPSLFGTTKLSAGFRAANPPFQESCFNEIDHLVPQRKGEPVLLSMKSSRWTIQLTMAKELNTQFSIIRDRYAYVFGGVVVGVAYGKQSELTDKYDILRGINRGKTHDVTDITKFVSVLAGRSFWSWINAGEDETQDWILDGILAGLETANCVEECRGLLAAYRTAFAESYSHHVDAEGHINWHAILRELNG
jgi:hypothetical protein